MIYHGLVPWLELFQVALGVNVGKVSYTIHPKSLEIIGFKLSPFELPPTIQPFELASLVHLRSSYGVHKPGLLHNN